MNVCLQPVVIDILDAKKQRMTGRQFLMYKAVLAMWRVCRTKKTTIYWYVFLHFPKDTNQHGYRFALRGDSFKSRLSGGMRFCR